MRIACKQTIALMLTLVSLLISAHARRSGKPNRRKP